jgi:hypothetical protein
MNIPVFYISQSSVSPLSRTARFSSSFLWSASCRPRADRPSDGRSAHGQPIDPALICTSGVFSRLETEGICFASPADDDKTATGLGLGDFWFHGGPPTRTARTGGRSILYLLAVVLRPRPPPSICPSSRCCARDGLSWTAGIVF